MKIRNVIACLVPILLVIPSALSVKVDGPGEAEKNSSHILTGTVTAIYSKITRSENHETNHCIAQIQIEGVEKGEGLKKGQTVFVRYLGGLKWIGKGNVPPGPGPHENCPKEGQIVRVCLVKNADESLDVYYVSGFRKPGEK